MLIGLLVACGGDSVEVPPPFVGPVEVMMRHEGALPLTAKVPQSVSVTFVRSAMQVMVTGIVAPCDAPPGWTASVGADSVTFNSKDSMGNGDPCYHTQLMEVPVAPSKRHVTVHSTDGSVLGVEDVDETTK